MQRKYLLKPMRTLLIVLSTLLLLRAGWASPFSENVLSPKSSTPRTLKELEKTLFPARLDGISSNPGFRILPKQKKTKEAFDLFGSSRDFFSPELVLTGNKKDLLSQASQTRLPYNLFLEANYNLVEQPGPTRLQDPTEYARILKTSSLGIAYPLTSKLTLDGRYVVVKSDNLESVSPLLGGTYRLNAATSISVSYPDISPANQNTVSVTAAKQSRTSAELKIHF